MENFRITHNRNIVQILYLYLKKAVNETENTMMQSCFFQSVVGLDNNLISTKQEGFKPGDAFVDQYGLVVRCIFLDISQAFNKVDTIDLKNSIKVKHLCLLKNL